MILKDINSVDLGFDIIVIGAGSAGCSFVNDISDKFKVLLIDSKNFPRKKACSGILVKESIKILGNKLNENLLVSSDKLDIQYVDFDNNLEQFSKKNFLNSDRFLLDDFLFNRIRLKKNVYFLKEASCIYFNFTSDKKYFVVVIESNGVLKSIICKYVVGCDGALSKVRKKIFFREIKYYIGIQEIIKVKHNFDKAHFIYDNSITDFYSWIIPKGKDLEVGALLDPSEAREKFNLFKKKIFKKYGFSGNGEVSSAIVLRPQSKKDICLGKDNIFLCGEAAGLISPSSAEGISYSMVSAKLCAKVFNENNDSFFKKYCIACDPLVKRLSGKFLKAKIISDVKKRKNFFLSK
jgi:geranylgeranyl diphosphate/geranylgeranyl-bacteriochlorophyllide a reductase